MALKDILIFLVIVKHGYSSQCSCRGLQAQLTQIKAKLFDFTLNVPSAENQTDLHDKVHDLEEVVKDLMDKFENSIKRSGKTAVEGRNFNYLHDALLNGWKTQKLAIMRLENENKRLQKSLFDNMEVIRDFVNTTIASAMSKLQSSSQLYNAFYEDIDSQRDYCASSPCWNGEECRNEPNGYTCECPSGWTGTNCDEDVDECSSSPCQNGAECINEQNRYTCSCAHGWRGTNCGEADMCAENDQFQCADGIPQCIPMAWLCDGDYDCNDGSDEDSCFLH